MPTISPSDLSVNHTPQDLTPHFYRGGGVSGPRASGHSMERMGDDQHRITCTALSSNGRVLATGSKDGTVVLWRAPDIVSLGRRKIASPITAVSFSPDGKTLVIGCRNGQVIAFSDLAALANAEPATVRGPATGAVINLSFHPAGDVFAVVTAVCRSLSVYSANRPYRLIDKTPRALYIKSVVWRPAAKPRVIEVLEAGWLCALTVRKFSEGHSGGLRRPESDILCATRHPNYCVLGCSDGSVRVLPSRTEDAMRAAGKTWPLMHDAPLHCTPNREVRAVACSPDGSLVAAGFDSGHICIFSIEGPGLALSAVAFNDGADASVKSLAFAATPDGLHRLLCLYADGKVGITDYRASTTSKPER